MQALAAKIRAAGSFVFVIGEYNLAAAPCAPSLR
jgi:NAD(P)H-dependent FMN reductase